MRFQADAFNFVRIQFSIKHVEIERKTNEMSVYITYKAGNDVSAA